VPSCRSGFNCLCERGSERCNFWQMVLKKMNIFGMWGHSRSRYCVLFKRYSEGLQLHFLALEDRAWSQVPESEMLGQVQVLELTQVLQMHVSSIQNKRVCTRHNFGITWRVLWGPVPTKKGIQFLKHSARGPRSVIGRSADLANTPISSFSDPIRGAQDMSMRLRLLGPITLP